MWRLDRSSFRLGIRLNFAFCIWEGHFVSVPVMDMVLLLMKKQSPMNLRASLSLEWPVQENRGDTNKDFIMQEDDTFVK